MNLLVYVLAFFCLLISLCENIVAIFQPSLSLKLFVFSLPADTPSTSKNRIKLSKKEKNEREEKEEQILRVFCEKDFADLEMLESEQQDDMEFISTMDIYSFEQSMKDLLDDSSVTDVVYLNTTVNKLYCIIVNTKNTESTLTVLKNTTYGYANVQETSTFVTMKDQLMEDIMLKIYESSDYPRTSVADFPISQSKEKFKKAVYNEIEKKKLNGEEERFVWGVSKVGQQFCIYVYKAWMYSVVVFIENEHENINGRGCFKIDHFKVVLKQDAEDVIAKVMAVFRDPQKQFEKELEALDTRKFFWPIRNRKLVLNSNKAVKVDDHVLSPDWIKDPDSVLKIGDILCSSFVLSAQHSGIYIGNGKVIHMSGHHDAQDTMANTRIGIFDRIPLKKGSAKVREGDLFTNFLKDNGHLEVVQLCVNIFTREQILKRARNYEKAYADVSHKDHFGSYSVTGNNCQHLATLCATGHPVQVDPRPEQLLELSNRNIVKDDLFGEPYMQILGGKYSTNRVWDELKDAIENIKMDDLQNAAGSNDMVTMGIVGAVMAFKMGRWVGNTVLNYHSKKQYGDKKVSK